MAQFLARSTVETGIALKHSRDFRFILKRSKTPEGFENYSLENTVRGERLIIPRELFDRFRSAFRSIEEQVKAAPDEKSSIDRRIYFKDLDSYSIRAVTGDPTRLVVQDLLKQVGGTGMLHIPFDILPAMVNLFYHHRLHHTNDVFDRIVRYHKLFHFSFTEGSESITSGLTLRKDVLSQIDEYVPVVGSRVAERKISIDDIDTKIDGQSLRKGEGKKEAGSKFKPRLGQKDGQQLYQVDYGALFQSRQFEHSDKLPKGADDQTKRGKNATSKTFPLPLMAGDIKSLIKLPFRCELSKEEATSLRENFLQDRDCEFYLGFEIIDAVFRTSGKLKSYRFPLYYMKVNIEESGRFVIVNPSKDPDIFLNHLALAMLVETFASTKGGLGDPVELFFQTLSSQKIEVQGRLSELRLHRMLPVSEEVFDRTRDILLGRPGENGKGGILGHLELIGIEADLESVSLYKTSTLASPLTSSLEQDMDRIQAVAHDYPDRFYHSLLGQFLTPEVKVKSQKVERFCERPMCHGALPKSTQRLLDKLNSNDLVLLEGPPGTGKTYTIMNLFIHCLSTGKRLLIVSDQKAAIHALTEKIEEYLVGRDFQSPAAKARLALWRQAIKIVDQIPVAQPSLNQWMNQLNQSLGLDLSWDPGIAPDAAALTAAIRSVDDGMQQLNQRIQAIMDQKLSDQGHVAPKYAHPTTQEDIKDLIAFLDFIGAGQHSKRVHTPAYRSQSQLLRDFIRTRRALTHNKLLVAYSEFTLASDTGAPRLDRINQHLKLVERLLRAKPRRRSELDQIVGIGEENGLIACIYDQWQAAFPRKSHPIIKFFREMWSYVRHSSRPLWRLLHSLLSHQKELIKTLASIEDSSRLTRQLQEIHEAMHPAHKGGTPLALEAALYTQNAEKKSMNSLHTMLLRLRDLQSKRDGLIKEQVLQKMAVIAQHSYQNDSKKGTNALTTIANLIEALKECSSIDHGMGVSLLRDLQENLYRAFPIWICRKQAVSFLFPSKEQLFDLVIIDEAGQCRVDDAIPLLYRAKRLMVVGDEKQTVLNKNSVVDDYLFREFNLEDHLRQTQARGMKGGGSHIFGLVKSIKQAEVMLDEHFRCPPDIIRYSNEYVYGSNLKVMQWQHSGMPPAVVVDYSEKGSKAQEKASSGKYKDIETDLIDHYLEFVARTIKKIEKETGHAVNMETDVALCYFLLKNEPYIKDKKAEFLQRLGRGQDVLDGAGAALQGKERDYIFYLWDVNRGNIKSFRQGDDPDKRKGELNVLMSRPKIRAYHFLHPEFETLKHDSASITDYLWKAFQAQGVKRSPLAFIPRQQRPGSEFRPWQRSSGQLMQAILEQILSQKSKGSAQQRLQNVDYSVIVGDAKRKVDLMLLGSHARGRSIGLVDLSGFEGEKHSANELIEYFFQLQRAVPAIEPIFLFLHELADERSESFQYLLEEIDKLSGNKAA